MTHYTIGFKREDGSFQVLATINNNGLMGAEVLKAIIGSLVLMFDGVFPNKDVDLLERQDAPDHINLEE